MLLLNYKFFKHLGKICDSKILHFLRTIFTNTHLWAFLVAG